jgi:hypothetical protein
MYIQMYIYRFWDLFWPTNIYAHLVKSLEGSELRTKFLVLYAGTLRIDNQVPRRMSL